MATRFRLDLRICSFGRHFKIILFGQRVRRAPPLWQANLFRREGTLPPGGRIVDVISSGSDVEAFERNTSKWPTTRPPRLGRYLSQSPISINLGHKRFGFRDQYMFISRKSIRDHLVEFGLKGHSETLSRAARPGLFYFPTDESFGDLQTRLGGNPFVLSAKDWPKRLGYSGVDRLEDYPEEQEFLRTDQFLTFVAQYNLQDLSDEVIRDTGLPDCGLLCLFLDPQSLMWGYGSHTNPAWKVMFLPHPERARLVEAPQAFARFDEQKLVGRKVYFPIHHEGIAFDALNLEAKVKEQYLDALIEIESADGYVDAEWSDLRLGGWPNPVQVPMEEECALASKGFQIRGSELSEKAVEILKQPNNWRLLFQLGTDHIPGLEEVEGRVFVWIEQKDILERRFDKTWLIMQVT